MSPADATAPQRNLPAHRDPSPKKGYGEVSATESTGDPAPHCRVTEGDTGIKVSSPLPYTEQAPSLARRHIRTALRGHTDALLLDDTLLVVTELVTNAVRHALPPILLEVQYAKGSPGTVHVEVADAGPAPRPQCPTEPTSPRENGRGTKIITALSTSHGARFRGETAIRWATLPAMTQPPQM
ncbi:hypothetical protein GCM10019016_011230 [Streptomyces prasinosporus]|uniref:Histidine kinase/HSP90-like ATPase domain-containing protein n=1 Tax=Streptomyces prasinosporus TaxID=68256 RepID=A0ABP6TFP2_9ACTN|nr:hypothetical protein GCM10010332_67260 [Streptomyces albogriseolus]